MNKDIIIKEWNSNYGYLKKRPSDFTAKELAHMEYWLTYKLEEFETATLEKVDQAFKKEWEERMEEAIRAGDDLKSSHVGYTAGVWSRLKKELATNTNPVDEEEHD
jgi:hypothetical protein